MSDSAHSIITHYDNPLTSGFSISYKLRNLLLHSYTTSSSKLREWGASFIKPYIGNQKELKALATKTAYCGDHVNLNGGGNDIHFITITTPIIFN